eukprot:6209122-Prymnesium_polylepis.1
MESTEEPFGEVHALRSLNANLDGRLASRTSTAPDTASEGDDAKLAERLTAIVARALDAPPLSADPAILIEALHCLACLVPLSAAACQRAVSYTHLTLPTICSV